MDRYPAITCVCPTHGRAHIIGEAVEAFERQDYPGELELLIVNDCPEQPLACTRPGVRVVNLPKWIENFSAKMNRTMEQVRTPWTAVWEDDDLSLPHRLAYSMDRIRHDGCRAFRQCRAWYFDHNIQETRPRNLFWGSAVFQTACWEQMGGAALDAPMDQSAWARLEAGFPHLVDDPAPADTHFIYRWGGLAVSHWSGVGGSPADMGLAFRSRTLAHPKFRSGLQTIVPGWSRDYEAEVAALIAGGAA